MVVDTSALREQVVDDVIVSAFGSAGQRCSSLRILFLPRETADGLIQTIAGAMDALSLGDPADPATDVGPLIDEAARAAMERHVTRLRAQARVLHQLAAAPAASSSRRCWPRFRTPASSSGRCLGLSCTSCAMTPRTWLGRSGHWRRAATG